jgi:kynurenine aminotransferase
LHPPADSSGVKSGADWSIDFDELRAAFSEKTKAIIINTPHNPVGKVFTREELTKIADLCKEFNVLCLADEVYDCMLYDGVEHVRMASLPGMWERTITIGSGGSECIL